MNRLRRIAIVVPAATLGMMLGSWVAVADPGSTGGCSSGYELMTVKQVIKTIAAPGFEDSIRAKDANGDGYLCIKIIPNDGGPKQFEPAFVYADNFTGS